MLTFEKPESRLRVRLRISALARHRRDSWPDTIPCPALLNHLLLIIVKELREEVSKSETFFSPQGWWLTPALSAFRRLRQRTWGFEVSLGYTVRLSDLVL